MSNIKYGLISETDARCLEKTIDHLLMEESHNYPLKITEVGVYSGETGNGMREYAKFGGRDIILTGIDNNKDKEPLRFKYDKLIIGNSGEVYNQIEDNSQHLIFIDALHTFPAVISDFYCYGLKVKDGGFLVFHDTSPYIDCYKDYQGVGSKDDADMHISVRRALKAVGLLILGEGEQWFGEWGQHFQFGTGNRNECWELVYDEYDKNNEAAGVCVFKKLY